MSILNVNKVDRPPNGNMNYALGCCLPCVEDTCEDIRCGEYPLTGPTKVHLKCEENFMNTAINPKLEQGNLGQFMMKRSFQIMEKIDDNCYEPVASVSEGNPAQLCCEKEYVIKYKWDNCLHKEPEFVETDACCDYDA